MLILEQDNFPALRNVLSKSQSEEDDDSFKWSLKVRSMGCFLCSTNWISIYCNGNLDTHLRHRHSYLMN